jgi:hypothetical protein
MSSCGRYTEEYVRNVLWCWDWLTTKTYETTNGKVKKVFTQAEVVEAIKVASGVKISVKTIRKWIREEEERTGLNK